MASSMNHNVNSSASSKGNVVTAAAATAATVVATTTSNTSVTSLPIATPITQTPQISNTSAIGASSSSPTPPPSLSSSSPLPTITTTPTISAVNGTTITNNGNTKFNILSHVKYEHLVAGISGGVASTLILHPLDLIKIRFAVNDGRTTTVPQYRGLGSAFTTIFRQEGLRGLYKGVTPNVWGSGSAWGFYFMFYNTIKTWIQGGNATTPLGPALHMLAASQAGVLTLMMTNPIWVVKTRLCLQYDGDSNTASSKRYKGMIDALTKIYKLEGFRGLYSGFVPGMFGVSHGALQFMTYEEMKNYYNNYRKLPIDTKLATSEYLVFAAISKLIAAAATYPYQVIRARLQDHHHNYKGTWDCVKQTWRYERMPGFYKGLVPYLVHVTPNICLVMLIWEKLTN